MIVLVDLLLKFLLKTKNEYRNFKEMAGSKYVYRNELNKACFQYGMTYGDFEDFPRRYYNYWQFSKTFR